MIIAPGQALGKGFLESEFACLRRSSERGSVPQEPGPWTCLRLSCGVVALHHSHPDSTRKSSGGWGRIHQEHGQGHRIKIGGLERMANPAFGKNLSFCGTSSRVFTRFVVALVIVNKYNIYVQYLVIIENPRKLREKRRGGPGNMGL
jgi:hypothetical protein